MGSLLIAVPSTGGQYAPFRREWGRGVRRRAPSECVLERPRLGEDADVVERQVGELLPQHGAQLRAAPAEEGVRFLLGADRRRRRGLPLTALLDGPGVLAPQRLVARFE